MTPSPNTPKRGKSANGSRAVAGKGIASVAHQIAIRKTTAKVRQASILNASGAGEISIPKNTKMPIKKPAL